jgi:hypothetical protein
MTRRHTLRLIRITLHQVSRDRPGPCAPPSWGAMT